MNLQTLLEKSNRQHSHICPRQILGVRMGLAGMKALGFEQPPEKKRLFVITETDGCFADGLSAATDCAVGHRTLRVEDYGKIAVTFVDVKTGRAVRLAPLLNIRARAQTYAADESRRYFAQMQAYQMMPTDEMFSICDVQLVVPIASIISRPGIRVNCSACGEEIMNEREVYQDGNVLCQTCARGGYYQVVKQPLLCAADRLPRCD